MKKYIFEIGGALGLIGSLIFVGIEIRQNTSAVRSSAQQAISEQITELYYTIAPDERLSNLLSRALYDGITKKDLSPTDNISLRLMIQGGLRRVENVYLQYKNGIISDKAFDRIGMNYYRNPYSREVWEENKNKFDKDFILFFEKLLDSNEWNASGSNRRIIKWKRMPSL